MVAKLPRRYIFMHNMHKALNVLDCDFSKNAIFARNTIGFLMVFRATTNSTGENGDKKQKTLPYTLKSKIVEVCLVGAGRVARLAKRGKNVDNAF